MPSPRQALRLALVVAFLAAGCGGDSGDMEAERDATPAGREAQIRAARAARADETGRVMVLEYHRVGGDMDLAPEWTISARQFRRELEYLRSHDYHPVNLRDFVRNDIDVPAGKTPVVLTFDDSSDSQFTLIRRDGDWVPDRGGAVGVLAEFHARHRDWPLRDVVRPAEGRPAQRLLRSAPTGPAQARVPDRARHGDRQPHALPRRSRVDSS